MVRESINGHLVPWHTKRKNVTLLIAKELPSMIVSTILGSSFLYVIDGFFECVEETNTASPPDAVLSAAI